MKREISPTLSFHQKMLVAAHDMRGIMTAGPIKPDRSRPTSAKVS
jgi:hypothetical protein